MRTTSLFLLYFSAVLMGACGDSEGPAGAAQLADPAEGGDDDAGTGTSQQVIFESDVEPITQAEDALPGVFIQPFLDCRDPLPGDGPGKGPDGKVCTPVSIAGCTEEGKYFADYADCKVVRTQRPFWPSDPANQPKADDPRLNDPAFMTELAWVTKQLESSGCVCCHDSKEIGGQASEWDIRLGPIWTDTISDRGLGLFLGYTDSRALGAYPAEQNNGFDRSDTGVPTTDVPRMKAFFAGELARRGLSEAGLRAADPFGGPVYRSLTEPPTLCENGEGVAADGTINLGGGFPARYVYILSPGTDNPGVPPNLDLPTGTLWRLDVRADQPPVTSGIRYGQTPPGTYQKVPAKGLAPALEDGKTYQLYVLYEVGIMTTNCLFKYKG